MAEHLSLSHLQNRALIRVEGADARTFLQGLISNNLDRVTEDTAIYAAHLTPQGKFLLDVFVIQAENVLLLDVPTDARESFLKTLNMFKLRAKVTLQAVDDMQIYAAQTLLDPPEGIVIVDPRLAEMGHRIYARAKPASVIGFESYDAHRIALGVPAYGVDLIPDKSILLECGFGELNGIDWNKGCYVGQELTARTYYRGLIKKRLMPCRVTGALPSAGSTVTLGGEVEAGHVFSGANNLCMAMIRLEVLDSATKFKAPLTAGESTLEPYQPAWMILPQPAPK